MNFIDDILGIIKTAPVSNIDVGFVKAMDPIKIYKEMDAKPGYRILIQTMTAIYQDAVVRGIDVNSAAAVILSTHEDILRYVIMKAVKDKLVALNPDELLKLGEGLKVVAITEKMQETKHELTKLEDTFKIYAGKLPINQFRYSLLYAAEKWGDENENNVVKGLVSKIPDQPIIKKVVESKV
jgi:hypothetical protein